MLVAELILKHKHSDDKLLQQMNYNYGTCIFNQDSKVKEIFTYLLETIDFNETVLITCKQFCSLCTFLRSYRKLMHPLFELTHSCTFKLYVSITSLTVRLHTRKFQELQDNKSCRVTITDTANQVKNVKVL